MAKNLDPGDLAGHLPEGRIGEIRAFVASQEGAFSGIVCELIGVVRDQNDEIRCLKSEIDRLVRKLNLLEGRRI